MENRMYGFRVAGHLFEVSLPKSYDMAVLLPSFLPFYNEGSGEYVPTEPILRVKVVSRRIEYDSSSVLLTEQPGALGYECRLYECDRFYVIETRYVPGGALHRMKVSRDFEMSHVFITPEDPYAGQALSNFIMFAYAQRSVLYKTFLLHASVVEKDGRGYAFLGKSGTGKSTHSSLWLNNISGTLLLNDDNPAVRVCAGTVWISGTPWSGKTPCYRQRTVKLEALVRLSQSPLNRFGWLKDFESLLALLPGCSSMRWNHGLYSSLCDILEEVVRQVPAGLLECLPDKSAAELCYEQIKIKTENEKK